MSLTYRGTLVADSKEPEKCELAVNTVAVIDDDDQENNLDQPAAQSFVDRFWIYEFLAWLACLAGLLGVITVLRATQDKPVPNWTIKHSLHGYSASFNVTINSVISLLSTAVKSTLLIPVVASLSQLKWLWFQAGNKLSDFQQFDSAAKGPLGALALIFSMRGRYEGYRSSTSERVTNSRSFQTPGMPRRNHCHSKPGVRLLVPTTCYLSSFAYSERHRIHALS